MYRGNRWYKCDFHLHTTASKCFLDKQTTAEQFIEEVLRKELECIAVTDHNSVEAIDEIREIGRERGITVFPGVEVTCGDVKTHLLVLFELDYNVEDIKFFLRSIEINPEHFGQDTAHSPKSVKDVIKIARANRGVVIPAHIDERASIATVSHALREELLKGESILAVQMVNEQFICHNVEELDKEELKCSYPYITDTNVNDYINTIKSIKKLKKGIMTFSDNPAEESSTKHGLWGIGKQYTWIKMGEQPNLESLKQALLMPEERIKNCVISPGTPHRLPNLWIKKIEIENIGTINEPLITQYSPQLTTIVGGRGSGKSTTVRLLTGIFNHEKIKEIKQLNDEISSFYKVVSEAGGVLTANTAIKIYIVKNEINYKVSISYNVNNKKYTPITTIEKEVEGNYEIVEDVQPNELFELDIYNQKQVYEMAQNPNVLKDKIDSLSPEITEIKQVLVQEKDKYITKALEIVGMKNKLKSKKKMELEINDIKEKISLFTKVGVKDVLKHYQEFDNQYQILKSYLLNLEKKKKDFITFTEEFKLNIPNPLVIQESYESEIELFSKQRNEEFIRFKQKLDNMSLDFESIIDNFKRDVKNLVWYRKNVDIKEEYDVAKRTMSENNIDIAEIDLLMEQLKEKQELLNSLIELEETLEKEYEELGRIKGSYIEKYSRLRTTRNISLSNLLKDSNIRIKLVQNREKQSLEKQLRRFSNKEQSFGDDFKKIVEYCLGGNIIERIEEVKKDFIEARRGKETKIDYTGRFINLLKELNEEQLAHIELFMIEDDVKVEYKKNGSEVFTPLTNASAGQRTSAILTFILSEGKIPLILDQPEDDLDNHLIYDLIVERLKKCKNERQIIVVTHNANIPVNGDAELIIGMDSTSKAIKVEKIGTIDEQHVKEEICNVMEGGECAFKMRAQKYGLHK